MVPDVMRNLRTRWAKLGGVVLALVWLAGCAADLQPERTGTVSAATLARMDALDMDRAAPILIRIFKQESKLEVWKQTPGRQLPAAAEPTRSVAIRAVSDPRRRSATIRPPKGSTRSAPGR